MRDPLFPDPFRDMTPGTTRTLALDLAKLAVDDAIYERWVATITLDGHTFEGRELTWEQAVESTIGSVRGAFGPRADGPYDNVPVDVTLLCD